MAGGKRVTMFSAPIFARSRALPLHVLASTGAPAGLEGVREKPGRLLAGRLVPLLGSSSQNAFFVSALDPLSHHSAPANVTFDTFSSFLTNTDWQFCSGETTMTYFSQMIGPAGPGLAVCPGRDRRRGRPCVGMIGRSGKGLGDSGRTSSHDPLRAGAAVHHIALCWRRSVGSRTSPTSCTSTRSRPRADDAWPARRAGGDGGSTETTAAGSSTRTLPIRREPDDQSRTSSRCCSC